MWNKTRQCVSCLFLVSFQNLRSREDLLALFILTSKHCLFREVPLYNFSYNKLKDGYFDSVRPIWERVKIIIHILNSPMFRSRINCRKSGYPANLKMTLYIVTETSRRGFVDLAKVTLPEGHESSHNM